MRIGLLGFGVVGRGVYDLTASREDMTVAKVVCLEDVSLPDAEVTKDLKFAKIFFSVLDSDPKEVGKALKNASGFFRSELAKRLNLRITPQLAFEYDSSMKYGANISEILKSLDIKPQEDEYEGD